MDIINYQKFIGSIIFGYFGIKIYYNLFFVNNPIKDSQKELTDFTTTCVMASLIYFFTNFHEVMNNSFVFYLGFIIGLNSIILNKIINENASEDVIHILVYIVISIYSIIFIIFYISQAGSVGGNGINPLIILISVISLIGGLLITKKDESTDSQGNILSRTSVKINMGILAWIGSLLLVHSSKTNFIGSITQAILIGCFVAYFSYYEPKYIFETQKLSLPTIQQLDEKDDKDIKGWCGNLGSNIVTFNSNVKKINKTIDNLKDSISKTPDINNLKDIVMTNRWISGLSLISVFVIVSLVYTKMGMSSNNNNY